MAVQTANITACRKLAVSEKKNLSIKKKDGLEKQVKTRELTRAKIFFFPKEEEERSQPKVHGTWHRPVH